MPFDWIFLDMADHSENSARPDETVVYPCDNMDDDPSFPRNTNKVVLSVQEVSHVYPDGTHAVKGISFDIREGEVLSYLGANGAGVDYTLVHFDDA
jgi:ABC-type uncharacterized transport system ATPase subunit